MNKNDRYSKYFREAWESQLSSDFTDILRASAEDFQKHTESSYRIKAYMNRLDGVIDEIISEAPYVIAFFDSEGYFIKVVGNQDVIQEFERLHIGKGSIWTLDQIGPNAVTAGLAERQYMYTKGEQNYNLLLKDYAIYFHPVVYDNDRSPEENVYFGGLALIAPADKDNQEYQTTLFLYANNIMTSILQSKTVYNIYESLGYSLIIVNINPYNNHVFTFYNSPNIFEIFDTAPQKISVYPTDLFFDPLPHNKKLWDIIYQQKEVTDDSMAVSIQGQQRECILTTKSSSNISQGMQSVYLFFTTPQKTAFHISRRIGNVIPEMSFKNVIGESTKMKAAKRKAAMIALTGANIMLLGESGVGKDVFARAIHNASSRKDGPFIAINCGALPRDLIASELFGYEGGAFTGARRQGNIGKFELANGGTIFLDEIGEMPLELQANLLRLVEQKQFMRLGGNREITVDVRIISATNVNLSEMVQAKRFRIDLYYRLASMSLNIPSLRERGEDILLLAEYFIRNISNKIGREDIMTLSDEAKQLLRKLTWNGNVRELQNLIECIVQLYDDPVISRQHIEENLLDFEQTNRESLFGNGPSVKKNFSREEILDALETCGGNRSQTARLLGIERRTLYRIMERLDIYKKKE